MSILVDSREEQVRARRGAATPRRFLTAVVVGSFMVALDSSTANVALPHIRSDFDAGSSVTWVVTMYLLGAVVSTPAAGWVAARWGMRRPYLASIAGFGLSSMLVAAAPNLPTVIIARGLVGICASPLVPIAMTMVTRVFPVGQRGRAIAVWSFSGVLGPALGPTVGGQIADLTSWRWLFLGAPCVAMVALWMGWRWIPDFDSDEDLAGRRVVRLDVRGLVLGPPGLMLAILALSQGQRWGWRSPLVLGLLVVGSGLVIAFVRSAGRSTSPLLDLRVLRVPTFVVGSLVGGFAMFVATARLVFVPLEMDDVRHLTTSRIGLLFLPAAAATTVGLVVSGRLTDRSGCRRPIISGGAALALASAAMATWSQQTPLVVVVAVMALHGLGHGLCAGPAAALAMSNLSSEAMAQGSTMRYIAQLLGGVLAGALLGTVLSALRDGLPAAGNIQHTYNVLFVIAACGGCAIIGLGLRIRSAEPEAPAR